MSERELDETVSADLLCWLLPTSLRPSRVSESGGIRTTWSPPASDQLDLFREAEAAARSRREGGGRRQSRPHRAREWPNHVLQPKALHSLLSVRHSEPDGGQLQAFRDHGCRSGLLQLLPTTAGLSGRSAASAAAAPPPPPAATSAPSPPVLILLFLSHRRSGTRRGLSRPPRSAAVFRWVLQRRTRKRRRAAVLPGDGAGRRSRLVQQPGAQIPDK